MEKLILSVVIWFLIAGLFKHALPLLLGVVVTVIWLIAYQIFGKSDVSGKDLRSQPDQPSNSSEKTLTTDLAVASSLNKALMNSSIHLPASGLIIDEPWLSQILEGRKTWEMRTSATTKRGRIALIRKGSKQIVGLATLVDSKGPLSDAQISEFSAHHRVPLSGIGKWRHAWVLKDVRSLSRPIPYEHRKGAVVWVTLDDPVVKARLAEQITNRI